MNPATQGRWRYGPLLQRIAARPSRSAADLEQQLDAATRHGWLRRAVAQLSPGIAEALQRRLAGESYQEIGDALGISTSNVGVRVHTAKTKLRALAADEG